MDEWGGSSSLRTCTMIGPMPKGKNWRWRSDFGKKTGSGERFILPTPKSCTSKEQQAFVTFVKLPDLKPPRQEKYDIQLHIKLQQDVNDNCKKHTTLSKDISSRRLLPVLTFWHPESSKYHSFVETFSHQTMKLQYLGNILYSVREKSIPEMETPRLTTQQASHSCLKTFYAINQCETWKYSQLVF